MVPTSQNISRFLLRESQILGEFSQYYWDAPVGNVLFKTQQRISECWHILFTPSVTCFSQSSFSRDSRIFMHGFLFSCWILILPRGVRVNEAYGQHIARFSRMGSHFLSEFSSIQLRRAFIKCTFEDITVCLCTDSQFLCDFSAFQWVWAWIKHTFQDEESQFLGEFYAFQAWLACFMRPFQDIARFSSTDSQLLGEFSSIQVGRPWIKCAFQDTARLLSRESQNVGESSLIKAGCAWIKRTFQDIAMYSRIKYQFPGEFSVFQGGLAWRMPLSQGITSLLFPELGKLSWFQVGLTCIKDTFQDIASFYSHATNLNFVANILQCDQDAI